MRMAREPYKKTSYSKAPACAAAFEHFFSFTVYYAIAALRHVRYITLCITLSLSVTLRCSYHAAYDDSAGITTTGGYVPNNQLSTSPRDAAQTAASAAEPTQTVSHSGTWSYAGARDLFIIQQLTSRDFKLKFRRSALGVLWSVLNPLLMMSVMALVFTNMLRFSSSDIPSFPLYIILGNIAFTLMADSTGSGMHSIVDNAALIKKVKINRFVFPIEKVLFGLVNFAISLIAVGIVMVVVGIIPSWQAAFLPVFMLYIGTFCVGLSLLLSALAVFFRDIMHLWTIVLTAWTYATPLFYPESILPHWLLSLEIANPMYHYVRYIREILLYARVPDLELNLWCIGFSLAALAIGWVVFARFERKFILYI